MARLCPTFRRHPGSLKDCCFIQYHGQADYSEYTFIYKIIHTLIAIGMFAKRLKPLFLTHRYIIIYDKVPYCHMIDGSLSGMILPSLVVMGIGNISIRCDFLLLNKTVFILTKYFIYSGISNV